MLLIIQMFVFFPSSHMEVTGIWFTKRLFSRLKVVIVFVATAQNKNIKIKKKCYVNQELCSS